MPALFHGLCKENQRLRTEWDSIGTDDAAIQSLYKWDLGAEIFSQLFAYCQALQRYNEHTNLVANYESSVLLKEHLLDSLNLLPWTKRRLLPVSQNVAKDETESGAEGNVNPANKSLIDIGSGAGFPGLVLAIAAPWLRVTLVDSIGKKCRFLESTCAELGLNKQVRVVCERAETIGHDKKFREKFDYATARAVGALPMVAELCLPLLKTGGLLLAQRSKKQALLEAGEAEAYASRLGGNLQETVHFDPDLLGREFSLLVLMKVKTTPRMYPRSAAKMKKP
jgi:16S rRNA (guanine527-N7)-methyltransferase